jgi:predicted CxxxxCH...CXXCH cytochrome family protein
VPWLLTADLAAYDPATGTCGTACHGAGRSPAWSSTGITCDGCHGVPPSSAIHAGISGSDLRACAACHPATVTAGGVIDVAGGKHVNGTVERVAGHAPGFAQPATHGPDYLDFAAGVPGATNCEACHGTAYGYCTSCHAQPANGGWAAWRTNCTFCHGARTPSYDAAHLASAAPPDAVSQRLTGTAAPARTGAHQVHLRGSAIAGPMRCDSCHEVPTTVAHVGGRDARAVVGLTAPGQAAPPDPTGWDTTTATCSTYCHGAGRSPPWTATGIACDGCHGVPPSTTFHAGVSGSDLTQCAGCHPATISAAGAIDVAGGKHVNGMVDRVGGHSVGFDQPASHGPQYLDAVAGAPGAADCRSCHGAGLVLCGNCHAQPANGGWLSWESNCTFCHGARTPAYDAGSLTLASPPDAVAERLSSVAAPTRTGKHRAHLNGRAGYPQYACGTCHAVPTTVSHVRVDRRAPVVFDAAAAFTTLSAGELAALPSPLAVYDASASTPTCASNYCHGATLSGGTPTALQSPPRWSSSAAAINSCAVCHGDPPDTGQLLAADGAACATTCSNHVFHVQALTSGCDACHHGGAPVDDAGLHVNGRVDVAWPPGTTGTWDGVAKTCAAMSCHSDGAPRSWR